MKTPNPEQKLAIEHKGGVLLSAGAGSGKTFVLVEHLVYLLKSFYEENKKGPQKDPPDVLLKKLRTYLSSLVFMTFTKKAAGELSLRMKKRMAEQKAYENNSYWDLVGEALPSLTVSTIHGFCFKLLAGGYFPELEPQPVIISELEARERLDLLMREWLALNKENNRPGIDLFLANSSHVLSALSGIFGSSELRSAWKEFSLKGLSEKAWGEFWKDVIILNDWNSLLKESFQLQSFDGILSDKQKEYLEQFENLASRLPLSDEKNFSDYVKFSAQRSPQFRKKEELGSLAEKLELLKEFRDFVKKNQEDLLSFSEHKNGAFLLWPTLFKELFDFCEAHYRRYPGFTFSDLEYFVWQGLKNPEARARIAKDYRYFVIDEFQDTSPGQYEIVRLILEEDQSRLFVVGDVKQAIYGFRGGELGVFRRCAEEIPTKLSLKNNYRSYANVITFNNELFSDLFRRGLDFEGHDPFSVPVEKQNIPTEFAVPEGKVCKLQVDLQVALSAEEKEKFKLKSPELAQVEAQVMLQKIEAILNESPQEKICLLYKKLAPAKEIVSLFLKKGISFSAQMKVEQGEDPLISIFTLLLEQLLMEPKKFADSLSKLEILIRSHFELLGFSHLLAQVNLAKEISNFYDNRKLFGLSLSFRKFVFSLGLSNSNFENNLSLIDILCQVGLESVDKIVSLLHQGEKSYSLDFKSGEEARIVLMTAHASKGLEFDHVFVGGIHANARSMPDKSYSGKFPGSFKWKADISQKTPYKSPEFILEKMISQRKDFSESKRLFYVATTRAKKALYWVDIRLEGRGLSDLKMDWINGFRTFEEETLFLQEKLQATLNSQKDNVTYDWEIKETENLNIPRPLFHYDNVGLCESQDDKNNFDYAISGELSVTRVATLCDCPRKFYLKNNCRFSDDELSLLGELKVSPDEKERFEEKTLEEGPASSMKRGSHIHLIISQMIKNEFVLPEDLTEKEKEMLLWLKNEFPKEARFISEEAIKFPLGGVMISGTPDLVLINKEEEFAIWDFKTGKRHPEAEDSYWFQVYAYGHAFFESLSRGRTNALDFKKKPMNFVLAYVDERKVVVEKKTHAEVQEKLFEVLKKLNQLSQTNLKHCARCPFQIICRP